MATVPLQGHVWVSQILWEQTYSQVQCGGNTLVLARMFQENPLINQTSLTTQGSAQLGCVTEWLRSFYREGPP